MASNYSLGSIHRFTIGVLIASGTPLPDSAAGDRSELARVRAAIADLPRNLREVLLLRGVEEMSQAETAALLDVSEKTVETRLYRARAKLKQLLADIDAVNDGLA